MSELLRCPRERIPASNREKKLCFFPQHVDGILMGPDPGLKKRH